MRIRAKIVASPRLAAYRGMLNEWVTTVRAIRGNTMGPDLLAGLTVAAVALPLNLALAVACGMPPLAGLVSGAVGGVLAGMFGGQTLQVTGPAAALSVMVLGLAREFGPEGVAAATIICGVVSLALAALLAGRLGKFVPDAVLAGFTTGVGVKLLDSQLPEFLGFDYTVSDLAQMMHTPRWLHDVSWLAVVCGLFVAFLVATTKQYKRFPAAIVGIAIVTFVAAYLRWDLERVGAVPSTVPPFRFPTVADERWLDLLTAALPLALLASIESLLSARAVDRMAKAPRPHDPNLELFGQGIANLGVGLLGGMPVTGVIVRSGVNVQSGARTRLATIMHGIILAGSVLYLGPQIAIVPLAALAGLLCVIGVRLIEISTFVHLARTERVQAVAFAVTCLGTVTGHLMLGLAAGLAIALIDQHLRQRVDGARARVEGERKRGVRAVLGKERAEARRVLEHEQPPEHQAWLSNIRGAEPVPRRSFVHPHASMIGKVVLGEHVHVAAGASVRADEGAPFFIGSNSNVQDGVVIHALKNKHVHVAGEPWAVYVGKNVSIAHDALVHGPCYVGDDTFIGFKAVVHDSIIGSGCFIGIAAVVVGVEIPDGRFVPAGRIVDSAEAVALLPPVTDAHHEFNEDVVEVNRGLTVAYRRDEATLSPGVAAAIEPPRAAVWAHDWSPTLDKERF